MSIARVMVRFVLAWIALLVGQMVAGMLIPNHMPTPPHVMPWLMVSNAAVALVITALALRSDWRDWRLALALFFPPAAIAVVNLIEGMFFLPNAHLDWRTLLLLTLGGLVVASVLWLVIFRSATVLHEGAVAPLPRRSLSEMTWRMVACAFGYLFLYYLAGMIIFPHVAAFYATQRIPPMAEVASMQLFLRGPVFVIVCLVLLRMLRLPRMQGAWATGLAFSLLSGVAPLIIPNVLFPDAVRWVHFCEVTSSNLLFGVLVGWLWGQAQPVPHLAHAPA